MTGPVLRALVLGAAVGAYLASLELTDRAGYSVACFVLSVALLVGALWPGFDTQDKEQP